MVGHVMNFVNDEEGATAIEYGLLAALIAAVIIAGVSTVGTVLNAKFSSIATKVGDAGAGS